ncbi:NAD(P)H-binding protein [Gammaproteobacteria bacterium AS21]
MKITVFGAAGDVGSRIVTEALARNHQVKAVTRTSAQFDKLAAGVEACIGDASNIDDVVRLSLGQDLVISAVRPPSGDEATLANITQSILTGVAKTQVRLLIVGGAASLKIPGEAEMTVLTAPNFLPDSVVSIAKACFAQHEVCKSDKTANWSYLSPPAMLIAGTRTGEYRLGKDELVCDANGTSQISMEDFAVVLIDEAEQPKHHRTRFTAAY